MTGSGVGPVRSAKRFSIPLPNDNEVEERDMHPTNAMRTRSLTVAAALQQPTTLTLWAWAPQTKDIVAAFEQKYPKVKVNLVNAGTATDEYTKLDNAIKAGSGAPDLAQIEYYALPQFALAGSLADLSADGLSGLKSQFSAAVWDSVDIGGKLVGLPQDTGPMALFYNKTVFDKYHLTVPTTWAQYAADAKKLHAAETFLFSWPFFTGPGHSWVGTLVVPMIGVFPRAAVRRG
jgi:ABC-type glycerol-3-phosphate transport system substrate-binding protein